MSVSVSTFADLCISLNRFPILNAATIDYANGTPNSIQINSDWHVLDLHRRDKISFTKKHLFSFAQSNQLDISWISPPNFVSFGKGFPFCAESGVRILWDLVRERRRVICLEYDLPSIAANKVKPISNTCPVAGKFIQIWDDYVLTKTINLSTKSGGPIKHGKIYSNKDCAFCGVSWSKDASRIVYLAEDASKKSSQHDHINTPLPEYDEMVFQYREDWGEVMQDSYKPVLCLLDLQTEHIRLAPTKLDQVGFCPSEPVWTPDDQGIVFVGFQLQSYNLGLVYCIQRPNQLYYWNLGNNNLTVLSQPNQTVHSPRFSPNGKYLIWLQNATGGPHGQCMSLVCLDWSQADKRNLQTIVPIVEDPSGDDEFSGLYCPLAERCWSADSRFVVISSHLGFRCVPLLIPIDSTLTELANRQPLSLSTKVQTTNFCHDKPPTDRIPFVSILDFFDDIAVACISWPSRPSVLAVLNLQHLNFENGLTDVYLRCWIALPECIGKPLGHIRGIQWQISRADRKNRTEFLLIQPNVDADGSIVDLDFSELLPTQSMQIFESLKAAKLQGVIVYIHGGPHSKSSACWGSDVAGFLACGFAVVQINYRGSLGYGNGFVRTLVGHIGDRDVSDCFEVTTHVLSQLRRCIPNLRALLYGGSHGGFLALHLAGRFSNLYSAAVVRNPVTHLTSMVDTTDIPDWCFVEAGLETTWSLGHLTLETELARLTQVSPLSNVSSNWSVPVLFCMGSQDRRVPTSQGLTFYRKLKVLCPQIPTELLMYPYDSHPLDSPSAALNVFVNTMKWFYTHLCLL